MKRLFVLFIILNISSGAPTLCENQTSNVQNSSNLQQKETPQESILNSTLDKYEKIIQTQTPSSRELYKEYIKQGIYYFKGNRLNKAKYFFIRAVKINPYKTDAYVNLANISIKRHNLDRAISILEKTESLPDKNKRDIVFYNLGLCMQKLSKYPEAISYYTKAVDINPKSKDALFNRGTLYIKNWELNKALVDILKSRTIARDAGEKELVYKCDELILILVKILPGNKLTSTTLLKEGSKSFESKNYEIAIALLKTSALIDPDNKETYYRLGIVYATAGYLDEAIKAFSKTIKIDPSYVKAYINLGAVYGQTEQYDAALKILNKARSIDKKDPKIYYNIAIAYNAKGMQSKCLSYLRKAKTLARKNKDPQFLQIIEETHKSLYPDKK